MIGRQITDIVIHCAATPNGQAVSVDAIDAMHAARGFKRQPLWWGKFQPTLRHIGYHYFIGIDGACTPGRHLEEIGAHVQGSNARSIGICMAGTDKFKPLQWTSLRYAFVTIGRQLVPVEQYRALNAPELAVAAIQKLGIRIRGHRDFSPDLDGDGVIERNEWLKICPGFDVSEWLAGGMKSLPAHEC
ncbi:MAG TPA: N-acetylmuramoyl-L-alanine amidase [Burkholderiales bacterium]|nr:N-acetylmuramoyl-L-alanine amidase [Burkholderiales bacterium]